MSRESDRIGYFATQERTLHVLIQIVVYRRELAADVFAASRHNTRYSVSKGERLKKKGNDPESGESRQRVLRSLTDNRQVSTELGEHMFVAILKLDLVLVVQEYVSACPVPHRNVRERLPTGFHANRDFCGHIASRAQLIMYARVRVS